MKKSVFTKTIIPVLVFCIALGIGFFFGAGFITNHSVSAAGPVLVKGDMDGDGKITTGDARTVLRTAIGLDKKQYITADDFNAAQTPASSKTYKTGETWSVPGKFSLTVNSVSEVPTKSGKAQEISIDISAENIGMSDGLELENNPEEYSFRDGIIGVYDEASFKGEEVGYHEKINKISVGKKGRGKLNWTFDTKNQTVTIEFCIAKEYKATYKCKVTPYQEAEKDPSVEAVLQPISLPQTYSVYSYSGKELTRFKVTALTYTYSGTSITLNLAGEKLYDSEGAGYSQSSKIGYKLYDSEGYVIKSGTIYTEAIKTGDKVKNVTETIYGVAPGTYRLELSNVK